ncbi:rhodanese-like domain-containing protein [Pseudodesulfovibrio senegalensis]|uniref:Sulfurtransferase n=1 Tax=Pseudodesulfovibrio senegalensis TaxID=1721087 RepID=A0A6N6N6B1_9BACT|nr:rhodanese-like domain-containing protein [Pseudodesulfovibrio senegalensis]KAB1443433.1 sulfurtransferase [Pseudodesulfovibrio senegalensis]
MDHGIENLTVDGVRKFFSARTTGRYTLLDVRQPWEYEDAHLPGARLLPLPVLAEHLENETMVEPVVVYCRTGARSMAAAKLLAGVGYSRIVNMLGGMSAWEGHVAFGPMDLGLGVFSGQEAPVAIVVKAHAMEKVLQDFYILQAAQAKDAGEKAAYEELAGFEEKHMSVLETLHSRFGGAQAELIASDEKGLGEGGVVIEDFLNEHAGAFEGPQGVLQLAMMMEAQACDYYQRCMRQMTREDARDLFGVLAREELAHLKLLGRRMDVLGE